MTRDLHREAAASVALDKGRLVTCYEADRVTFTIAIPDKALSPNARVHWAKKAAAAKKARHAARWIAVEAWGRVAPRHDAPKWPAAVLDISAYWKDKRSLRDDDNLIGSLKPHRDGLADAGLVENDKGLRVGVITQAVDKDNPRIVLTVTKGH